jgi:DNA-binding NtrC family response regulator
MDDDHEFLAVFSRQLLQRGFAVQCATSLEAALELQSETRPAAVLLDHAMPGTTAVASLERLRRADPTACLIVLSGEIDVPQTVQSLRAGAEDVMTKPPVMDLVLAALDRGLRRTELLRRQRWALPMAGDAYGLLDGSVIAQRLLRQIEQVAMRGLPVLLIGEAGTGRRALAQMIHHLSPQSGEPFVSMAMQHRSDQELREALASAADTVRTGGNTGATWFLDDVGLLSGGVQAQLEQFLQALDHANGPDRGINLRHRVITSTSRDLHQDARDRRLAVALMQRLSGVPVAVPALRERGATAIADLANRVLELLRIDAGCGPSRFHPDAVSMLAAMAWPRNVPQLRAVVADAVARAGDTDTVQVMHLVHSLRPPGTEPDTAGDDWSLHRMEQRHVAAVLAMTDHHRTKAAQLLGISRTTLYKKIAELGLEGDQG